MKRAVGQQLEQLKARLGGYVAMLVYRYANLCVEANPFALLSTQVEIDGEKKKIEEVAQVAVHETYHFVVIPIYEDDIFAIGKAILMEHPEFKQEIKSFDGFAEEDPAGKFLFYTMPEVNKERHDIMIQAVDALYDECTQKMTMAQQDCVTQLAVLQADSSPAEIEQVAEVVKQIADFHNDLRDKNRDTKKEEIEKAYAEYQARQEEKKAKEDEQKQEQGNPMQMMMDAAGNVPQ